MRHARFASILGLSIAATALVSGSARAQPYRCTGPDGTYYSDRACPSASAAPPMKASRPAPPVARPTDHLSYMSAECASLNDGMRNGTRQRYTRSQAELRADFRQRCAPEEAEARRRWQYDQGRLRQGQAEQLALERDEADRKQADQQLTLEQCREMRRIIAGKNERRAQLTPGELADLRRFEGNFATRCQQRAAPWLSR